MFIVIGATIALCILCLLAAIISKITYNPLLEEAESTTEKEKNKIKVSLNEFWRIDENSPVASETALTIAVLSAGASLMLGVFWGNFLFGLAAAVSCFTFVPRAVETTLLNRKVKAFRKSFEFGLENLLAALEVGKSLQNGATAAAKHSPEPVKSEFTRITAELAIGVPEEKCFESLAKRVPCTETEELADAISLYKNVGGIKALNLLKAVLINLREGMNADFQVQQQTKGVKTSAKIVTVIPFVYFAVMMVMAPDLFGPLFTTSVGRTTLFISLLIMLLGIWLIMAIMKSVDHF